MAAAEEVAGHDAVAVGCARGGAGSAWAAGSAVRAEVGSGDRPGGDAGGGERPQGDLALGSPAAAGSAAAVWNRERALSLPRHLSLLLPGSSTRRPWWRRSGASTEIIYLITSLPPETASPERLLRLARDHWGIENKLHYVRDVAFAEDRCRVRAGARPLAALRNLAIPLIRRAGLSIPEARENFREERANAISLVTGRVL